MPSQLLFTCSTRDNFCGWLAVHKQFACTLFFTNKRSIGHDTRIFRCLAPASGVGHTKYSSPTIQPFFFFYSPLIRSYVLAVRQPSVCRILYHCSDARNGPSSESVILSEHSFALVQMWFLFISFPLNVRREEWHFLELRSVSTVHFHPFAVECLCPWYISAEDAGYTKPSSRVRLFIHSQLQMTCCTTRMHLELAPIFQRQEIKFHFHVEVYNLFLPSHFGLMQF